MPKATKFLAKNQASEERRKKTAKSIFLLAFLREEIKLTIEP